LEDSNSFSQSLAMKTGGGTTSKKAIEIQWDIEEEWDLISH